MNSEARLKQYNLKNVQGAVHDAAVKISDSDMLTAHCSPGCGHSPGGMTDQI